MQFQNIELLKSLSDIYVAKNKLEEFLKMLLRFLQDNSVFLGNDIKNFKKFKDFFQNIKISFDLSLKASPGGISEQLKTLLNESEILKKTWAERNMPLQETKLENDHLLKLLENLQANNLLIDKKAEGKFSNILKENLENLEKMHEKAQQKNLDYEKLINNFLDSDDINDGFKNTLRSLIEYKKKLDSLKYVEDEIKNIQKENEKKNLSYLTNFEKIENWFKKNNDIFKDCENLRFSVDTNSGIGLMEKNLK